MGCERGSPDQKVDPMSQAVAAENVLRISGAQPQFMTPQATAAFHDSGCLIVEDAVPAEQIELLREEALKVCRGDYGKYDGWVGPHDGQTADEILRQYLCLHLPHKVSPTILRSMALPPIVEVLTHIIGPDVKCMQSMFFIKAAGKPGQAWHQDELYIPTRDRSLTGAWVAIDDATVENGCLWVIPGSQKPGVLWPQHEHYDKRFDCAGESIGFPYTDDQAVPVEVKTGSIVFFNGYLLHRSLPNVANAGYRRSLVNHYMSAQSLLPWRFPADPGLPMAQADYRDIIMVAGKDPYAWKPIENLMGAHVRPSSEGGCINWGGKKPT
jgi:ectoine hydroxylase-related dioxygenase (phytanoyl-CoA dioxygenase family)